MIPGAVLVLAAAGVGLVAAAFSRRRTGTGNNNTGNNNNNTSSTSTGGATGSGATGDPSSADANADDAAADVDTGSADDGGDTSSGDTSSGDTGSGNTSSGDAGELDEHLQYVPRDMYGRQRTGQALARYRAALLLDGLVSSGVYRGTGGNRTTIENAQRDLDVPIDGKIGPQTLAQVAAALVSAPSPQEAPTIADEAQWRARTVARRFAYLLEAHRVQGRTPPTAMVREAQQAMGGIAVDGRLGNETRERVTVLLQGPLAADDVAQRTRQIALFGTNGERAPAGV